MGNGLDDVLHVDPVAGVVADVMERARHVAIVNREDIGGLAGGNAERRDEMRFAFEFLARHHFVKEGGGFVTGAVGVGHDAGERRIGKFAEQIVIIDTDDGDFVGNSDTDAAAGVEDLLAAKIVTGHHADRFGKTADPVCERVRFFIGAARAFSRSAEDRTRMTGSAE